MSGWAFVGYIDEHGEERQASYQSVSPLRS
jgi:hypothetical protein